MLTVGTALLQEPAFETVMLTTLRSAVALAPVGLKVKLTGPEVYPVPEVANVIATTVPVTVNVAPVPPPPLVAAVGNVV
jgi:hypothetical protein